MKDSFAEINVVPLVDIMLVLIVIVLITANFMVRGQLEVRPPQAESAPSAGPEGLRLEIDAAGTIFYDRRELSRAEIPVLLHGLNREQPVLISADKELRLQPFVTLLDDLRRLGFNHISVQTTR